MPESRTSDSEPSAATHIKAARPFELSVSLPKDPRYVDTARELAVHAAKYAGCTDAAAQAFGERVKLAVTESIQIGSTDASLPLIVRRTTGPVEFLIDGRIVAVDV